MEIKDQNFKNEIENFKGLSLVDFYAAWCGPCKMMGPIIEELAKEYEGKNIKIVKLNVDENRETSERFNIMSIPTLIFFKDGKKIEQLMGLQSKDVLIDLIEKNIK